jgi:hypothetical protein
MAIDFARSRLLAYAEEDTACEYTGETRAVRQARYEECARALFEVPRGRFHHSLEWQDFFRLQCGECILWDDQLCRAHCHFFGRGAIWTED